MPDPSQNIVIEFTADTSALAPAQQDVENSFKQINDSALKTQKTFENSDSALKKYVADLVNLQKTSTAAFTLKGLTEFEKGISKTTNSTKILAASIALAKQNLDQFQKGSKEWENLNNLIQQGDEFLKQFGNTEDQASEKAVSLKTQLRQMKEELATIDDPSNPRFVQLATQAAHLEDKINDTRQQVQLLSSDTRHIDAAIQTISGLAGAFAVAQGAAALLGDQGEELQQALLKVNAAMAILQGLQQIQALLDKNSALNLFLIKTLRLQNTAAMGAETVATEGLAAADTEATVAQEGLNTAMAANPAAVLILTLTTLVGIVVAFTKSTNDAANAQDRLNDQLKFNADFADGVIQNLDKEGQEAIARLKARGATEKQLRDEELLQLKIQLSERTKEEQKAVAAGEDAAGKLQELAKNNFEVEKHYQQVLLDGTVVDRFKRVKVDEDYLIKLKETQELGLAAQGKISDLEQAIRIKNFENQAATNQELLEDQKKFAEQSKEIAEKNAQALFEIKQRALQKQSDLFKEFSDTPDLGTDARLNALQEFLQKQQALLNLEKQHELDQDGLTSLQRLNIIDKYNDAAEKLTEDGIKMRKTIIDEGNAEQVAADQAYYAKLLADQQKAIDTMMKSVDDQFGKISKNNSDEQIQRLQDVENEYQAGTITLQQFLDKRNNINKEFDQRDLDNQIASIDAKISNMKALGLNTDDLEKQRVELLKQHYAKDTQNFADAEQLKLEAIQKRQQIENASFQLASNVASNFFQGLSTFYENDLQQVQELAQQKLITEQEAARRTAAIRREQAIADKAGALFNIAIDTAQAIVHDLRGNKFLIPFDIATGILEAALVAARPVPQFKKGKIRIDGPGTETSDSIFAMLSRNESVINAEATKKYEPALKAINEMRFEEYIIENFPQITIPTMTALPDWARQTTTVNNNFNAKEVGEEVAKVIKKMPGFTLNVDERGLTFFMEKENQLTEYVNKKYRFNKS